MWLGRLWWLGPVVMMVLVVGTGQGQVEVGERDRAGRMREVLLALSEVPEYNVSAWRQVYQQQGEQPPCQPMPPPSLTQQCWLGSWLRWCPTSPSLLRQAEKTLLSNLRSSYQGRYTSVGCSVGGQESYVWSINLNQEGKNEPIVLLHGFGSGVGLWCLNLDSLAQDRPVYALDILGFGRSSRPQFSSDALEAEREFIDSIEAWRNTTGLDHFILLGHSFGGFLAASYAIKHPDRVTHLVLADPWGLPERPLDVEQRYRMPIWVKAVAAVLQPFNPLSVLRTAGPLGPKLLQKARPDLIRKFSGQVNDAEGVIPEYLYHCNAQSPTGESAFRSLMAGFGWAKYPMIQRMDLLRPGLPLTVIYGARSWVDHDPGFQIKYMRPDSYVDVQVVSGAGHHVYADRAEAFNTLVRTVGRHTDQGTLPPLAPEQKPPHPHSHSNPTQTLTNMINVRNDQGPGDTRDQAPGTSIGEDSDLVHQLD